MTTWILTDEAGRTAVPVGEWVHEISRKLTNLGEVMDIRKLPDPEVKNVLTRHGIELMLSDDLTSPLKSDLRPPPTPPPKHDGRG